MTTDLRDELQSALGSAYAIERELGGGGMSRVFLATETALGRRVVIKVLPPEMSGAVIVERFRREIQLAARLQHPHIVPLLSAGEAGGLLYYMMPYVEGEDLRVRLTRAGELPLPEAVQILRDVAKALAYAHRRGIVHRDLKPENVLLSDGSAVVTDFGVAKALSASTQSGSGGLTSVGVALGTPAYMAPEQALGDPTTDHRADLYALGIVAYELLSGAPPFAGRTPQQLVGAHAGEAPEPLLLRRPDTPPALATVIMRLLEKGPANRPQTAEQVIGDLEAVTPSLAAPTLSDRVGSRAPQSSHRRVRRVAPAVLAGILLLAGVVVGLVGLLRAKASSAVDPNLVAVAPFEVLDPTLELWREGVVDLLSRNLDGAGPLRTVPPTIVIRRWTGHADQLSAATLGRRTNAGLTVFGTLVPAGADSSRLTATLYDVAAGRALAEVELRDAAGRIDRLTDSLTVRLLRELGRRRRIEVTRVASLGSTSLPALKAFLQGEQWFRRAAWDSALAAYDRAVALDSTFCLAHWRLGRAVGWQRIGFDSLAAALSLRAGALNRGLAPRDSLLVVVDSLTAAGLEASWSWYKRLVATAEEAVRRYPDDADAWHTLGEVYVHQGVTRGVPPREALAAFDRAIALDSAYAPAYIHAIEFASGVDGLERARRYAGEYLRRAPEDVTAEGIRLALDLADPRRGRSPETQRALETASPNVLLKAWLPFLRAPDSGEVAVRVARVFAASPESSAIWLPVRFRLRGSARTLAYRGHLDEALALWNRDTRKSSSLLAELSLFHTQAPENADTHFREWLRMGDLPRAMDGLLWWTARDDSTSIQQLQQLSDSIARSASDSVQRQAALYSAAASRAYLALARNDTSGALRRFETLPDLLCPECYFESLARVRIAGARREDRKVLDAADRWLSFYPVPSHVILRLEGARAAERLGDRDRAMREYQFVADAWRHADAELQPYVAEAKRALERLSDERPEGVKVTAAGRR